MRSISFQGKTYSVDSDGFLLACDEWDENFARGMAEEARIAGDLTPEHWKVIRFIREKFQENGACPLVYQACQENGLHLRELKKLFPTGYLRGACKLAGITYRERLVNYYGESGRQISGGKTRAEKDKKVYRVNAQGFLVDPAEWDENFAVEKAHEMKMKAGLTDPHWKVIYFLRKSFQQTGSVPTVYETCEENKLELEDLEKLFPDGYHRGAVKLAGLEAR